MSAIIQLLPIILPILSWIIERSGFSNDTKKKYFKFLDALIADEASPARLRKKANDYKAQALKKVDEKKNE